MSHSRKKDRFWKDTPGLHCPGCRRPQSHHGLCLDCQRAADAAADTELVLTDPVAPEKLARPLTVQEQLPPPLTRSLGDLLQIGGAP